MRRVMLDLETLGSSANAAIIQIGACWFNVDGDIIEMFKRTIDFQSAIDSGGEVNGNSINWWLQQSEAARLSVVGDDLVSYPITQAMIDTNTFLEDADEIWSHATFDFTILTETFRRLKIKLSFKYRCTRDIRTLCALYTGTHPRPAREGAHHDALDDAVYQAKYVAVMLKAMGQK